MGLGLHQTGDHGQVEWSPTLSSHIAVDVLRQTLSDGNRRWEFTISPRHSVARTERMNLDLGVVVSQLSTTKNLDNGYYDPKRYEYYAATAFPYWKVRESVGIGLSLAAGVQRDDLSPAFRFGGNATAEATFGIYDPWGVQGVWRPDRLPGERETDEARDDHAVAAAPSKADRVEEAHDDHGSLAFFQYASARNSSMSLLAA